MNFTGPFSDVFPDGFPGWCRVGGQTVNMRKIFTTRALPLPIDEVMLDLRVDSDDELETVRRLVRASCSLIEKRSGFAVLQGTYEALLDGWFLPWPWEFMRAPFRGLVSIEVLDVNSSPETWQAVAGDEFRTIEQAKSFLLYAKAETSLPEVSAPLAGIRVRFNAGFDVDHVSGESASGEIDDDVTVPLDDQVRTAIMMLTAEFYANRELFSADKAADVERVGNSVLNSIRQRW